MAKQIDKGDPIPQLLQQCLQCCLTTNRLLIWPAHFSDASPAYAHITMHQNNRTIQQQTRQFLMSHNTKVPLQDYVTTLSQKKGYQPTTNDNFNNSVRFQKFMVQILRSKYVIEMWFHIPPHLFIVRTLPWETLRPRKSQVQQPRSIFLRYLYFICP